MSKWKRPATKTYDYNFKLGEHYYKPQLDYLDCRKGRSKTPPTAKTFAERFAADPIYGGGGLNLRRSGVGDGLGESSEPTGLTRFGSLDDVNLAKKGSSFGDFGSGALSPTSPRLIVGDRLLDSVGIQESKLSQPLAFLTSSLSSSSKSHLQSSEAAEQSSSSLSRRKVGFAKSAQADLVSEDPMIQAKSKLNTKMIAARKQADDMLDEMNKESDSQVSRFRARAQARKEEQSRRREQLSDNFGFEGDDDETALIRSKVHEIGLRAKARLANLEDDFPEIQIGSSLAARRAANKDSSFYNADEEDSSSRMASASSKTMKITKRTIKASYEVE